MRKIHEGIGMGSMYVTFVPATHANLSACTMFWPLITKDTIFAVFEAVALFCCNYENFFLLIS